MMSGSAAPLLRPPADGVPVVLSAETERVGVAARRSSCLPVRLPARDLRRPDQAWSTVGAVSAAAGIRVLLSVGRAAWSAPPAPPWLYLLSLSPLRDLSSWRCPRRCRNPRPQFRPRRLVRSASASFGCICSPSRRSVTSAAGAIRAAAGIRVLLSFGRAAWSAPPAPPLAASALPLAAPSGQGCISLASAAGTEPAAAAPLTASCLGPLTRPALGVRATAATPADRARYRCCGYRRSRQRARRCRGAWQSPSTR